MASRLSRWMSAARASAFHASGLSLCIILMPASQTDGAPTILAAMRSGQCQLSGMARAMVPGRNDQRNIPASIVRITHWTIALAVLANAIVSEEG
ncbi:MAG: hypothetical protein U0975_08845 [Erythrobacter sp.]|jgi:hypothetical protein|nr:hypothetical protein [Erythrobacter sp.]